MGSAPILDVEALIVGAGFGAFTTLQRLRKIGVKAKIFEKGPASGGIWYWNCYPGARVDSDSPIYQLFEKELYEDWTFKERYSGWEELRQYFKHVEKKWDLNKDIVYDADVQDAQFDESKDKWLITCKNGLQATCRWFIPAIGFAAKHYTPPIKGLDTFKGEMAHTAKWPQQGMQMKGKRIAVIGTGASGVQTIQECGADAKHLTIYQRTPNYACPMNQRELDQDQEEKYKKEGKYDEAFNKCKTTFAGFDYDFTPRNTFDDSPEEREAFYHNLLIEEGGFKFWLNTYKDMLFDEKANEEAYNFWRKMVHSRVKNKEKADLLAPKEAPHPWGTKRPSLEQNYYEVLDMDHVDIVDVNKTPIEEITETGVRTKDGLVEVDIIALATGFDSVTGSLAQLNIKGTDGKTIAQHWSGGLRTSMGIACNKFPNMFYLYGPQAPTAFSNGPSCTQFQAEWIVKTIDDLRNKGITRIEATDESEQVWTKRMHEKWDASLFPRAKSWYQGANIPGKRVEPLNWAGGMVAYLEALRDSEGDDYKKAWSTSSAAKAA